MTMLMSGGNLIILILLIINFIVLYIIATFMEKVAILKGYNKEDHFFAIAFLSGILGCLYIIALPDLKLRKQNDQIIQLLGGKPDIQEEPINEELPEI